MIEFISNSPDQTEQIAASVSKILKAGDVIAFRGGLGMGKTRFTAGLARGLGFEGDVTSPTFALVNEYIGGRLGVWHFDMYRVSGWEDLYSTGFFDYLEAGGVTVCEWSENIEAALPEGTIYIEIEPNGENSRIIKVSGGENFEAALH